MFYLQVAAPLIGSGTPNQSCSDLDSWQVPWYRRPILSNLGTTLSFPGADSKKWLQIVNTESGHWILLAKGFLDTDSVLVFDSIEFTPQSQPHVVNCICRLEKPIERAITFWSNSCQRQGNNFDCGVYAIAFAVSLAFGDNPSHVA